MKEKNKESLADAELNKQKSRKRGLAGLFENLLRGLPTVMMLFSTSPLIFIYILCIGISCIPGVSLTIFFWELSAQWTLMLRSIVMALAFSTGGFLFVLSLVFVVPIFNMPFAYIVKKNGPYKGPWMSTQSVPWYMHNALIYLVRYTILDFITPSPLNTLFYKMMGMKMGKNVMINTSNISDACLITLEDNVTIGGSAVIMAHYGVHGLLVIEPLTIKEKTTIGLNAKILGGGNIGSRVTIGPNAVVLPKHKINDGEKFGIP